MPYVPIGHTAAPQIRTACQTAFASGGLAFIVVPLVRDAAPMRAASAHAGNR